MMNQILIMFQSTHPVWGATKGFYTFGKPVKFQSTHPVWGATRYQEGHVNGKSVSIHAPRVGCDELDVTV